MLARTKMPGQTDTLEKRAIPRRGRASSEMLLEAIKNPTAVTRELNNRSLYHFLQHFWPVVSAHKFHGNWHIELMCRELEQVAERVAAHLPRKHDLIINVPPGSTKTITCSIMFPAWCWTRWHWMRFICASYSSALSMESAEYCRDLIRSTAFQEMYPEIDIKEDKDTKSNFKVVKRLPSTPGYMPKTLSGGSRYSTSVGGTLTGFHGDILIVDDPLNPQQAVSDTLLRSANDWCERTLSTRKTDKAITATIFIMQRLHQDDPSGHLLAKDKRNVKHISLPGESLNFQKQVKPHQLLQYYKDNLLDPVRMPWSVLKDLEADLGQYGYAGQIGQNPVPPGGGMFKVDKIMTVDGLPDGVSRIHTVRYWDKAGSQGAGAFTAGGKMSALSNGKWLMEDMTRGQWGTDIRERWIKSTALGDTSEVVVWIEQEPGSGGKESAEGTIRNLAGWSIYAERPTGDKIFRADPFSVQVNNGNVWMMRGDWNQALIEELRFFPYSTYKDQVDAMSGAFNKLVQKKICRRVT